MDSLGEQHQVEAPDGDVKQRQDQTGHTSSGE